MRATGMMAWAGACALVLGGFLCAPQTVKADGLESIQTIKLMADAKTMALQLKADAATMKEFGQLDIKWEAHAATVGKMRDHVAAMQEMVDQLKTMEATAVPWEKTVIDRIGPYMAALAADNNDVMNEFDDHPSLFGTTAAKAYLAANAESAAYLSALVVNFMENGTLRQTIQDYDEQEDSCKLIGVVSPELGVAS